MHLLLLVNLKEYAAAEVKHVLLTGIWFTEER